MTYLVFTILFLLTFLSGYSVGCGVTKARTLRILAQKDLLNSRARKRFWNDGFTNGIRMERAAQLARQAKGWKAVWLEGKVIASSNSFLHREHQPEQAVSHETGKADVIN